MRDPDPQILGGSQGVAIWGGAPGEVAGALSLLADLLAGRQTPGAVAGYAGLSRRLVAVQEACAACARAQQADKHKAAALAATSADPNIGALVFLPPAQAASASDTVTVAEAADRLHLSQERIRQLAASGRIRGERTARRVWMLERASVTAYTGRRKAGDGRDQQQEGRAGGDAGWSEHRAAA